MRRMLLFLTVLVGSSGSAQNTQPQYVTSQAFALHKKENGVAGTLQLSIDARLTSKVREELWGNGDWDFALRPDSELAKDFATHPPLMSKLSIRDESCNIVAERELKRPLARIESWNPGSETNQRFLVTQDFSAGFGSYNGPVTTLFMVTDATLREITALDPASHQERPITLMKSLKSDWRIARRDADPEILAISCHPKEDGAFVIDYLRYSFEGGRWLEYKRESDGFWDSDRPFPDRSAFP